jgi:hypothetical protein
MKLFYIAFHHKHNNSKTIPKQQFYKSITHIGEFRHRGLPEHLHPRKLHSPAAPGTKPIPKTTQIKPNLSLKHTHTLSISKLESKTHRNIGEKSREIVGVDLSSRIGDSNLRFLRLLRLNFLRLLRLPILRHAVSLTIAAIVVVVYTVLRSGHNVGIYSSGSLSLENSPATVRRVLLKRQKNVVGAGEGCVGD